MQRQRDFGFGAGGIADGDFGVGAAGFGVGNVGGGFGGGNVGGGFGGGAVGFGVGNVGGGFGGGNVGGGFGDGAAGFGVGNVGGGFARGNAGGGFGGGFGRARRNDERERRRNETVFVEGRGNVAMSELREEFKPEFTDEKRNEWLKWIDERSKQYSIEPATRKKFAKDSNGNKYPPDIFVYSTNYGTFEVQEQFVENFVAKPVDSIMKSRGKRDPLAISQYETSYKIVIPSTDPPGDRLMHFFVNSKLDYTEFCEDLYENYQDMGRGYYERINAKWDFISFDEFTDELCLKIQHVSEHSGRSNLKTPGKFFNKSSVIYDVLQLRNSEIQIVHG